MNHLSDNIGSVRHHSAMSLAEVYKKAEMYQDVLMERFKEHVKTHILKAKTDQKATSQAFKSLSNETEFGVAKYMPGEDFEHSNQ